MSEKATQVQEKQLDRPDVKSLSDEQLSNAVVGAKDAFEISRENDASNKETEKLFREHVGYHLQRNGVEGGEEAANSMPDIVGFVSEIYNENSSRQEAKAAQENENSVETTTEPIDNVESAGEQTEYKSGDIVERNKRKTVKDSNGRKRVRQGEAVEFKVLGVDEDSGLIEVTPTKSDTIIRPVGEFTLVESSSVSDEGDGERNVFNQGDIVKRQSGKRGAEVQFIVEGVSKNGKLLQAVPVNPNVIKLPADEFTLVKSADAGTQEAEDEGGENRQAKKQRLEAILADLKKADEIGLEDEGGDQSESTDGVRIKTSATRELMLRRQGAMKRAFENHGEKVGIAGFAELVVRALDVQREYDELISSESVKEDVVAKIEAAKKAIANNETMMNPETTDALGAVIESSKAYMSNLQSTSESEAPSSADDAPEEPETAITNSTDQEQDLSLEDVDSEGFKDTLKNLASHVSSLKLRLRDVESRRDSIDDDSYDIAAYNDLANQAQRLESVIISENNSLQDLIGEFIDGSSMESDEKDKFIDEVLELAEMNESAKSLTEVNEENNEDQEQEEAAASKKKRFGAAVIGIWHSAGDKFKNSMTKFGKRRPWNVKRQSRESEEKFDQRAERRGGQKTGVIALGLVALIAAGAAIAHYADEENGPDMDEPGVEVPQIPDIDTPGGDIDPGRPDVDAEVPEAPSAPDVPDVVAPGAPNVDPGVVSLDGIGGPVSQEEIGYSADGEFGGGTEAEIRSIEPGEGWSDTLREMGVPANERASLLELAADRLQDMNLLYIDQSLPGTPNYGLYMTENGQMPQEALDYLKQVAAANNIPMNYGTPQS